MAQPMYQQIADDLRGQIESGLLPPGARLPTEIQLRERYNASRNTVRDAIKLLTTLSLVETRPGQGTFVVERLDPFFTTLSADAETGLGGGEGKAALSEVKARGLKPDADTPDVGIKRADVSMAEHLGVAEGTQLISRYQPRYINGTPWSLQTSYYPMDLVTKGAHRLLVAEDIPEGTITYLKEQLGLVQVGYQDIIHDRPADDTEVSFFKLPADGRIHVFVITRIGYADNPEYPVPFRVTISVFPADRNRFIINVPSELATLLAKRPLPAEKPG